MHREIAFYRQFTLTVFRNLSGFKTEVWKFGTLQVSISIRFSRIDGRGVDETLEIIMCLTLNCAVE